MAGHRHYLLASFWLLRPVNYVVILNALISFSLLLIFILFLADWGLILPNPPRLVVLPDGHPGVNIKF